jgi:hypothetical protein
VSESRDSEGPDQLLAFPLGGGAVRQGNHSAVRGRFEHLRGASQVA